MFAIGTTDNPVYAPSHGMMLRALPHHTSGGGMGAFAHTQSCGCQSALLLLFPGAPVRTRWYT